MKEEKDYIVRATAADTQIRAFACTTKTLVEEARKIHNTSPVVTAALGRLLSAGAMMGSMLKGDGDLLTINVKGDGPVRGLTVTADSHGNVKGYPVVADVLLPASPNGKLDVGRAVGHGTLSVSKDLGMKEPYSGQVLLVSGEIAEDLTHYFAVSEQIPSSVGLGVLMERNNTVRQAGGFLLQLMPFAEEAVIDRLEENLKGVTSVTRMLDEGDSPERMLEKLLAGLDVKLTDTMPAAFHCECSREKIEKVLTGLGKSELAAMIDDGKEVEVNCSFCGRHYLFDIEQLKALYNGGR